MGWALASYFGYGLGAIVCVLAALWIGRRGDTSRPDRRAAVVALGQTAIWCTASAAYPASSSIVFLTEIASNVAWIYLLFRLFANDGRDESLRLVRPVIISLVLVELLQLVLLLAARRLSLAGPVPEFAITTAASLRVLVAVGAIVLIHNLYAGAAISSRQLLRWNTAALAGLWAFQLNFYTIVYLTHTIPLELNALRGVAAAAIAIPFAVGYSRHSAVLRFSPSRALAFRSLSLLVIAAYLLLMLGLAHWIDQAAGDIGRLTQVGLVIAAAALSLVWLPSRQMRGWLRVTAVKHLFKHRYDYRNEWIRFTNTIGRAGLEEQSLHDRVIKALADITESEAGLLLMPDDDGSLALTARWRWATVEVPPEPLPASLAAILEREDLIVDLDEIRAGTEHHGELAFVPRWLIEERQAWVLVPLQHFDRLVGVVVLARPLVSRKLDWEAFDLLSVVGRQSASYLAEEAGQTALLEASRFEEFNRRMAFVMHDIKNLSSQMSLLLRNAEKHAENPEFRKDMLVTLRNSAEKLNTMLARLGRYAAPVGERSSRVDLAVLARGVAERLGHQHPVMSSRAEPTVVLAERDALDQAVGHLVQNAIDASVPERPVMIETYSDGINGIIQVIDNGHGMSPAFLRTGLFKPFISSKDGGFGIGAYEAREMVRAMGGRLDVESREGLGSRFTITLPLQSTARILRPANAATTPKTENA